MAKWVCSVCGYVHEGDTPPEKCPVCKVPAEKFIKQEEEMTWAAEHVLGVAPGGILRSSQTSELIVKASAAK